MNDVIFDLWKGGGKSICLDIRELELNGREKQVLGLKIFSLRYFSI